LNALVQTWRVACYEWFDALRSRRALVVLLLYLAAAVCNMHWSINLLHKLESELATALQLRPRNRPAWSQPPSGNPNRSSA